MSNLLQMSWVTEVLPHNFGTHQWQHHGLVGEKNENSMDNIYLLNEICFGS